MYLIPKSVNEKIHPIGSQRPWLYGLPKIHKPNIPLRLILSIVSIAQHYLTKWLSGTLEPVLKLYSEHCIYDSFTFAKVSQNISINSNNSFLCLIDILCLYTNILLDKTIAICAEAL